MGPIRFSSFRPTWSSLIYSFKGLFSAFIYILGRESLEKQRGLGTKNKLKAANEERVFPFPYISAGLCSALKGPTTYTTTEQGS